MGRITKCSTADLSVSLGSSLRCSAQGSLEGQPVYTAGMERHPRRSQVLMAYSYAHSSLHVSTLIREASYVGVSINTETHLVMVVHTFDPSTAEAVAGGCL